MIVGEIFGYKKVSIVASRLTTSKLVRWGWKRILHKRLWQSDGNNGCSVAWRRWSVVRQGLSNLSSWASNKDSNVVNYGSKCDVMKGSYSFGKLSRIVLICSSAVSETPTAANISMIFLISRRKVKIVWSRLSVLWRSLSFLTCVHSRHATWTKSEKMYLTLPS